MTQSHTPTPYQPKIGDNVKMKNWEGDPQWNCFTVYHMDEKGIFHAKHNMEYSCYTAQVNSENCERATGVHHDIPYLEEQSRQWRENALAKAKGGAA